MIKAWKLILSIWSVVLLPATNIQAQVGFEDIRNHCNTQIQSRYRSFLADTQQIVFAGVAVRDVWQGACDKIVSVIGAYSYSGNLLWSKHLDFEHPIYKSGDVPLNALCKLSANRFALVTHGSLCDETYIRDRPFLYFFNQNGDSLGFAELPISNPQASYTANTITTDAQNNILIAGLYRNHPLADTGAAWLAKFTGTGQFLWLKHLSGGDYAETYLAYIQKIVMGNSAGQYVLCGNKSYLDTTVRRTEDAIWKTDMQGNVIWQRNLPKYNGWDDDYFVNYHFFDIVKASNGSGYYFAASGPKALSAIPEDPNPYRYVAYCGKIDEDGKVIWAKTYEIDTLSELGSVAITQRSNGDLLIIGALSELYTLPPDTSSGATLLCTDSMGHVKWIKLNRHYNCPDYQPEQSLVSIAIAPVTGNIVRVGGISQNTPQPGCWDTAGAISWILYTDSMGRLNPNDTITYPLQESDVDFTPTSISIQQKEQIRFDIYPNPTNCEVSVALYGKKVEDMVLSIYDYTGRLLKTKELKTANERIDLKNYNSGLYIFKLKYKGQDIGTQKLIKQ